MERVLLFIDFSGSTSGCTEYWDYAEELHKKLSSSSPARTCSTARTLDGLFCWSDRTIRALDPEKFERPAAFGGTYPQCIFLCLREFDETEKFNLHILTDGEIYNRDIEQCLLYQDILARVTSAHVYYKGDLSRMNLGLSIILENEEIHAKRTINGNSYEPPTSFNDLIVAIDNMALDEFDSPNFKMTLSTRVKKAAVMPHDETLRNQVNRLRDHVIKAVTRHKTSLSAEERRTLFESNDREEYARRIFDVSYQETNKKVDAIRSRLLNLIDDPTHSMDLKSLSRPCTTNLSSLDAASGLRNNDEKDVGEIEDEENEEWSIDSITFENLDDEERCFLLRRDANFGAWSDQLRKLNPFAMLACRDFCDELCRAIEIHVLSLTSARHLMKSSPGNDFLAVSAADTVLDSPFTRCPCHAFLLNVRNKEQLRFNEIALSTLFNDEYKLPRKSMILWHVVVIYIVATQHPNLSDEMRARLLEAVRATCESSSFEVKLTLVLNTGVEGNARIDEALWFCCYCMPLYNECNSCNILRSVDYGHFMFDLFYALFPERVSSESRDFLIDACKRWRVWNYLLKNRDGGDKLQHRFRTLVRAQIQPHVAVADNDIVLVKGSNIVTEPERFVDETLNVLPAKDVWALFCKMKKTSRRLEPVMKVPKVELESVLVRSVETDSDYDYEKSTLKHVRINPITCRPFVICPVTGLHWRECAGTYNVKTGSLLRTFHGFCQRNKRFPKDADELLYHHFWYDYAREPIPRKAIPQIQRVFELFRKDIMSCDQSIDVETYLSRYDKFGKETDRLAVETVCNSVKKRDVEVTRPCSEDSNGRDHESADDIKPSKRRNLEEKA